MELWLLSHNWFRHGLRHLDYNYTDGHILTSGVGFSCMLKHECPCVREV